MITFKHKKHMHDNKGDAKVVIYYNISDIFLGITLLILVVFFINDYLSHALPSSSRDNSGNYIINDFPQTTKQDSFNVIP